MKTILFTFVLAAGMFYISANSCKSKKQSGSSKDASSSVQLSTSSPAEEKFRLVVSFYSIGEGIDGQTHEKFVNFVKGHYKKVSFESIHWGKEGEIDYCLSLKELSAEEQEEFVQRTKDIVGSRVHVMGNKNCTNKPEDKKYRLVVSFYSIGEGIDLSAHEKFETLLKNHSPKIKYEAVRWGREGEVDYCMNLAELSAEQQKDFVESVKRVVTRHINVLENAPCRNKR